MADSDLQYATKTIWLFYDDEQDVADLVNAVEKGTFDIMGRKPRLAWNSHLEDPRLIKLQRVKFATRDLNVLFDLSKHNLPLPYHIEMEAAVSESYLPRKLAVF